MESGTKLGHYEILSLLGKGGMGEVWRARDTKLGREVAIKTLPEELAQDADRLARFEREAKLLASLNHPNIAAIHGFEEDNGTHFLVLELVEGDTLADRLKRGAIPVEESLTLALQIAEALEAAHEKGVIHRDLKPANIKVTPDGNVKVLDFGLAKAFVGDQGGVSAADSPTLSMQATGQGVILGTAAYMSPEQARGLETDKRADIWAFGIVLYEMLTGSSAFGSEDVSLTLADVMRSDVAWDKLPDDCSPTLVAFLKRCLAKDPKQRVRDIGDVRLALDGAFDTAPGQEVTSVTSSGWARALALASAAAVLAGLAVAFVGWTLWPQPRPLSVVRLADQVPIAVREGTANFRSLALSQDGRYIAYSTGSGLFLRAMDQPEGRLLPLGSGGRSQPFFSPDGRSLGFLGGGFTTRQLMRIAVDGEAPVVIADVGENVEDMFWARDNTILYSGRLGLYQVAAGGGTPALVIAAGEGQRLIAPQLLADGETVLFTIESENGTALVAVQSLASEERTIVVERGGQARQLPTGHLVYLLDGNLFAVGFDEATWTTSGVPVSVASGIRDRYSVTDDGTLAYLSGGGSSQSQLVWVDAEGQDSALGLVPGDYSSPRLSPDEARVMLQTGEGISIYSLGRGTLERIADGLEGAWSPDSTAMAYIRDGLWRVPVNETDEAERMATLEEGLVVAWSPDGMKLVFLATDAVDPDPEVPAGDLGVVDLAGEGAVTVLRETPAREDGAWISPDGRWIAVESILESGSEILVWPFGDGGNGRWQISTSGGWDALWSRSGDALFYRQDREIMKVSITGDDPSEWSRPEVLFELDDEILANSGPRQIDLASDGRFLMLKSVGDENSQTRSIVVLNWFQELLERVPVD